MDIFCEQLVKKQRTGKDILISIGFVFAAILVAFVVILFFAKFMSIGLLAIVGAFWGAVKLISNRNVEYEYIVTNSVLDIDKIMAKKSRKRVFSVDFKDIEACRPVDNGEINGKIIDLTPAGIEDGVYRVDFMQNAEKTVLLFKPNIKVITNLKNASPRLVTVRPEDIKEQ